MKCISLEEDGDSSTHGNQCTGRDAQRGGTIADSNLLGSLGRLLGELGDELAGENLCGLLADISDGLAEGADLGGGEGEKGLLLDLLDLLKSDLDEGLGADCSDLVLGGETGKGNSRDGGQLLSGQNGQLLSSQLGNDFFGGSGEGSGIEDLEVGRLEGCHGAEGLCHLSIDGLDGLLGKEGELGLGEGADVLLHVLHALVGHGGESSGGDAANSLWVSLGAKVPSLDHETHGDRVNFGEESGGVLLDDIGGGGGRRRAQGTLHVLFSRNSDRMVKGGEAVGTHVLHQVLGCKQVGFVVEEDARVVRRVDCRSEVDEVFGLELDALDKGKRVALVVVPVGKLVRVDTGEDILGQVLKVLGEEAGLDGGGQELEAGGSGAQVAKGVGVSQLGGDELTGLRVVLHDGVKVGTTHAEPVTAVELLKEQKVLDVREDAVDEFAKVLSEISGLVAHVCEVAGVAIGFDLGEGSGGDISNPQVTALARTLAVRTEEGELFACHVLHGIGMDCSLDLGVDVVWEATEKILGSMWVS